MKSAGIKEASDLECVFHPRSVAVVGASSNPSNMGYGYIRWLRKLDFKGEIYPINPNCDEVLGIRAYPSISDAPPPVDYVISNIPAPLVPQLAEDCVASGVRVLQLFTAGFSETGEEEGIRLEEELADIARRGNLRVIGPNCLGVYCPKTGLAFSGVDFPRESGPVAFISQSGGNAGELTSIGCLRGIRFSKVISYGNACDLNETDFIDYFARDPDTTIITAYIEGVKNGPGFIKALREATRTKPVIMLKGGRTESGTRAVASHTNSLAGASTTWNALCKQFGVIQVNNLNELVDLLLTFLYLSVPKGRNVGIIGIGGGASVQAADDCNAVGLFVPPFPQETKTELKKFTPQAGTSINNPIDSSMMFSPGECYKTIEIAAACSRIDLLILYILLDWPLRDREGLNMVNAVIDSMIRAGKATEKPIAIVLNSSGALPAWQGLLQLQEKCLSAGFPVFHSVGSAALALSRFIGYHENRGLYHND